MRSFSVRHGATAGDAPASGGGASRRNNTGRVSVRRVAAEVAACARGLAARVRSKEPRPAWFPYAMTALAGIAAIVFCLYVGLAAILYFAQRSMMYFPETIHTTPAQAGLTAAEEVTLTASDGVKSVAWHVAPG